MKAMILAAGFGKRLLPLTENTPKALVEVQGKTVLEHNIQYLSSFGYDEIVINVHHLHEKIISFLKSKKWKVSVTFSQEKEILGTGGGLYKTKDFWGKEDFLLINVDILCKANLAKFRSYHLKTGSIVTLAVNQEKSESMLLMDEQNLFCGLYQKGQNKIHLKPKGDLIKVGFCGIHLISPGIFNFMKPPISSSIIDEYVKLLKQRIAISTWNIRNSYWIDIGTPETLEKAISNPPRLS